MNRLIASLTVALSVLSACSSVINVNYTHNEASDGSSVKATGESAIKGSSEASHLGGGVPTSGAAEGY